MKRGLIFSVLIIFMTVAIQSCYRQPICAVYAETAQFEEARDES
jgi:hypothetical protein